MDMSQHGQVLRTTACRRALCRACSCDVQNNVHGCNKISSQPGELHARVFILFLWSCIKDCLWYDTMRRRSWSRQFSASLASGKGNAPSSSSSAASRSCHSPSLSLLHTHTHSTHHVAHNNSSADLTAAIQSNQHYISGIRSLHRLLQSIKYLHPEAVACPLHRSHADTYIPAIAATTDRIYPHPDHYTSQTVLEFVIKLS